MNTRYAWIDFVKALAIVLVVLYHSGFLYYTILFPFIAMCVPLFFVVNGMLVLSKERNTKYFLKKVCKIIFVMIFWSIIQTIVIMYLHNDIISFKEICNTVLTQKIGYCNTFWFMANLVVLYMLYPFVNAFNSREKNNIFFVLIITFLLSFKAFGYVLPISPVPNLLRSWHGEALFYAVSGFCIFKYSNTELLQKIKVWYILILIMILWGCPLLAYTNIDFFTRHMPEDPIFCLYESPFVMLMTVIVVLLIGKVNPHESKLISALGKNTLGIYCLHPSIMGVIRLYIELNNVFIKNMIVFVGALLLSLLISMLLQKNKYTQFLINL